MLTFLYKCSVKCVKSVNNSQCQKEEQKQRQHLFVNETVFMDESSLCYCSFTHKSTHVMLRFLVIGKPAG